MSSGTNLDVTALLLAISKGEPKAREELIPLVYDELRKLARGQLKGERDGHTLEPTALVHEVYQRWVDQERVEWKSRAHFFAVAAVLMRRVLVDYARKTTAQRRGGGAQKIAL